MQRSRMDTFRVICPLVLVIFFNNVVTIGSSDSDSGLFNLKIIHNNDFHSYYDGIAKYALQCDDNKPENCFGGIARLQYLAKQKKNDANTIFLNAGDNFHGSAYYKLFGWGIVANLTKHLPLDAMSLGNHEFDDEPKDLVKYLKQVDNIPCVCANINASKDPELEALTKKSVILNVGGKRIGVVGYVTPDTVTLSRPGPNITFTDEIDAVREEAKRLRDSNLADIVIALGHSGYPKDLEIAEKVEEIDVVVGGHSNTFLYTGTPPLSNWPKAEGLYPTMVQQPASNKAVPVVQAYAYGVFLGNLDLTFDSKTNKLLTATGDPILIDHATPEDKEMKAMFQYYNDQFEKIVDVTVGQTSLMLEGGDVCRLRECGGGNYFSDIILLHTMNATMHLKPNDSWALSSIVFLNGGTIRTSMGPGPITIKDLFTAFPFQNEIQVFNVSGDNLWQALECAVSGTAPGAKPGGFPQLSGIHAKYNLSKPAYSRVMEVSVRCHQCVIPRYSPLDRRATYPIISTDYLLNGGDGIKPFINSSVLFESEILSEVIVEGFQMGTYFTEITDRVTLLGNATKAIEKSKN